MDPLLLFQNDPEATVVRAGTTIFHAGEPADAMYVILEGEVEVLLKGKTAGVLRPGEFFGEMALLNNQPRVATVVAQTDCRLSPVNERRFLLLVQHCPEFSLHVMRILSERLRRADILLALHGQSCVNPERPRPQPTP